MTTIQAPVAVVAMIRPHAFRSNPETRAHRALPPNQITVIERSAHLLPLAIPTKETAGGSVRCMIAGLHLTRRPQRTAA